MLVLIVSVSGRAQRLNHSCWTYVCHCGSSLSCANICPAEVSLSKTLCRLQGQCAAAESHLWLPTGGKSQETCFYVRKSSRLHCSGKSQLSLHWAKLLCYKFESASCNVSQASVVVFTWHLFDSFSHQLLGRSRFLMQNIWWGFKVHCHILSPTVYEAVI